MLVTFGTYRMKKHLLSLPWEILIVFLSKSLRNVFFTVLVATRIELLNLTITFVTLFIQQ